MRSGWNAADSSSSSSSSSEEHHRGTEARKGELPRGSMRDADAAEESLTEARGGGGGAARGFMRDAEAATGLWATDMRGFPASQAHMGAVCCALDQARCGCCGGVSHGGTEARRGSCRAGTGALQMLRRSLSRRHGGAEGELRAGSGAMRMLRRSLSRRHGGAEGELPRGSMRDAVAATGLWATDLRGFPASQAHMGADCCALDQARCCGCDWF